MNDRNDNVNICINKSIYRLLAQAFMKGVDWLGLGPDYYYYYYYYYYLLLLLLLIIINYY